MSVPGWVMLLLLLAVAGAVFGLWMWAGRRVWAWADRRWIDPWLRRRSGLPPAWRDEPEDYGCCALDEGHDGPCAWKCSTCGGTGRCPVCNDRMVDDLDWCDYCEKAGCPGGCYEGWVTEDVMLP